MSVTKQQEKYKMIISADDINSTDNRFTINNLYLGNNYKPLKAVFKKANGATIERVREKGERSISNQTLPRIAFQIFEKQIIALAKEEKEQFPICQYASSENIFRGIYSSIEEFRNHINSIEYLTYRYADDRLFVIYCWNIFSTLHFVQECLKRFGEPGDYFELTYREKDEKETTIDKTEEQSEEIEQKIDGYRNPYSSMLIESKNIIFRGAPGTGKSYLAKEIAADIISNGYFDNYTLLSDEQKQQVEFVQFHPSYDYSDFVEGLSCNIRIIRLVQAHGRYMVYYLMEHGCGKSI